MVREYVGFGELASLIAEHDEAERQRRQAERVRRRRLEAEYEALDAEFGGLCELADAVPQAVLLTRGGVDPQSECMQGGCPKRSA